MTALPRETARARPKLFGLVRDKDGKPKVDDPKTLPPEVVALLTPQERRDLGLED